MFMGVFQKEIPQKVLSASEHDPHSGFAEQDCKKVDDI